MVRFKWCWCCATVGYESTVVRVTVGTIEHQQAINPCTLARQLSHLFLQTNCRLPSPSPLLDPSSTPHSTSPNRASTRNIQLPLNTPHVPHPTRRLRPTRLHLSLISAHHTLPSLNHNSFRLSREHQRIILTSVLANTIRSPDP